MAIKQILHKHEIQVTKPDRGPLKPQDSRMNFHIASSHIIS